MTAVLPAALEYGTVRWRVVGIEEDDTDPDELPQSEDINGTVTFRPIVPNAIKFVGTPEDLTPVTILPRTYTYPIEAGVLKNRSGGNADVRLVACDSPGTSPQGWQYLVEYQLDDGYSFGSFYITLNADEVLDLTLAMPQLNPVDGVLYTSGPPGAAATVDVGTVTTGPAGSEAEVVNSGNLSNAVFDFVIPTGDQGVAGTVAVGGVTTGPAGSAAAVENVGTPENAVLDFTIPRGDKGDAATVAVGTVTTGNPGSAASVENVGTAGAAVFDFVIPEGRGFTPRGTWAAGQDYFADDVVGYQGSTYLVVNDVSDAGLDPASSPSYQLWASRGAGVPAGGADGQIISHDGTTTVWEDATPNATPDLVVRRDASGRAKVVAPSTDTDIALLSTVKNYARLNNVTFQAGTAYTLVAADQFREVDLSNAAAITVTVPPNSAVPLPTGTLIPLVQFGTGQFTVSPGAGVTVSPMPGRNTKSRGQFAVVWLLKRDVDHWMVFGDTEWVSLTAAEAEVIQDMVGGSFTAAGTGLSKTYDDAAGTLTWALAAGGTQTVYKVGGVWTRPTTRTDIHVIFKGAAPGPAVVAAPATNGMYDGVDTFLETP